MQYRMIIYYHISYPMAELRPKQMFEIKIIHLYYSFLTTPHHAKRDALL